MSDERKPMTDDELCAIQGRLKNITPPPWFHVLASIVGTKDDPESPDATCVCCTEWGYCGDDPQANATFIAAAPTDIARLLAEVDRLREEKEILEGTLDSLGIFVQENLNYCAADFIGEGIDEDAEFTCKTEYDPDNGCQKCYSNCWAEVFRKTAEEEINALKELEKENAERP